MSTRKTSGESPRNLLPLWDYGWLDCDEVIIPRCSSALEVVSAYINGDSFGTSFISPVRETAADLHGPFWRTAIKDDDFQLISPSQFATELSAIRQPEGFYSPAGDDQWKMVEGVLSKLQRDSKWIIALHLNEQHHEKFHDFGFVLLLFREFLFANPLSDRLSRCVFGYD